MAYHPNRPQMFQRFVGIVAGVNDAASIAAGGLPDMMLKPSWQRKSRTVG